MCVLSKCLESLVSTSTNVVTVAPPRCAAFAILIGLFKCNDPLTADLFGRPAPDPLFFSFAAMDKMASRFSAFSQTPAL